MSNQSSRAIYSPSISTAYLQALVDPMENYRDGAWPDGLTNKDLTFVDPDCALFHHDAILLSPGQYLKNTDLLRRANLKKHPNLTIIGDSLGFQFIENPALWQGRKTLDAVLAMQQEFFDWAMIVDIPSRITTKGYPGFLDVTECRDITVENIRHFVRNRKPGSVKHLNVIQGQFESQAFAWYDTVKDFPLEGWAFGGYCRLDLHFLLRLILRMRDEQILEKAGHFHFLGTGTLSSSLALSLLKQGVDKIRSHPLPFTFDTSTPFKQAMTNFQIFGYPKIYRNALSCPMYRAPRSRDYIGDKRPFPYQTSAIAERLTCGDLCVRDKNIQEHAWDSLSGILCANHNMESLLRGMEQAHALYALERDEARPHFPEWLLTLKEVVPEILTGENAGRLLSRHQAELKALSDATIKEEDEAEHAG